MTSNKKSRITSYNKWGYIFLIPFMVVFVVFQLIPLVTTLGGSLPSLFGGALITETLFSIRGIGYASYTSMTQGDIPFIMFYLAFISILTLLGNLISDLLYAVVDPRVRLS